MRLIWTEPALGDLRGAEAYIAWDNRTAADAQIGLILAAADGLVRFEGPVILTPRVIVT